MLFGKWRFWELSSSGVCTTEHSCHFLRSLADFDRDCLLSIFGVQVWIHWVNQAAELVLLCFLPFSAMLLMCLLVVALKLDTSVGMIVPWLELLIVWFRQEPSAWNHELCSRTRGPDGEFCFDRHSTGEGCASPPPVCLHFYISIAFFLFSFKGRGSGGLHRRYFEVTMFYLLFMHWISELYGSLYST